MVVADCPRFSSHHRNTRLSARWLWSPAEKCDAVPRLPNPAVSLREVRTPSLELHVRPPTSFCDPRRSEAIHERSSLYTADESDRGSLPVPLSGAIGPRTFRPDCSPYGMRYNPQLSAPSVRRINSPVLLAHRVFYFVLFLGKARQRVLEGRFVPLHLHHSCPLPPRPTQGKLYMDPISNDDLVFGYQRVRSFLRGRLSPSSNTPWDEVPTV